MRIFQVMMNDSEQWDDSMSKDETRKKWNERNEMKTDSTI